MDIRFRGHLAGQADAIRQRLLAGQVAGSDETGFRIGTEELVVVDVPVRSELLLRIRAGPRQGDDRGIPMRGRALTA